LTIFGSLVSQRDKRFLGGVDALALLAEPHNRLVKLRALFLELLLKFLVLA
jgi:hypothetical protein